MFSKSGLFLVLVCCWITFPAGAAESREEKLERLTRQLEQTRAEAAQAQKELAAQTKVLWQKQHDLEYQDPEAIKLREKIVGLETQLIELRKQLDARLKSIKEIREVQKEREALVKNLQDFKETERLIQNEITAVEYQSSSTN